MVVTVQRKAILLKTPLLLIMLLQKLQTKSILSETASVYETVKMAWLFERALTSLQDELLSDVRQSAAIP